MRKNRRITDLKYDSKRQLGRLRDRAESIAAKWGDVDFFISSKVEKILDQIDEIVEEIDGVDVKSH